MKLRLAKKVLGWGEPVYSRSQVQQAWDRVRRYQNNGSKGRIIRSSLRLVRYITTNREDTQGIRERWQALRAKILAGWNPEQWDEDEYQRELIRFDEVRASRADSPDDPTVRLEYDLSYYSDRWCTMRVAFIDRTIQELK